MFEVITALFSKWSQHGWAVLQVEVGQGMCGILKGRCSAGKFHRTGVA